VEEYSWGDPNERLESVMMILIKLEAFMILILIWANPNCLNTPGRHILDSGKRLRF